MEIKLGWIGLGHMGEPMSLNLLKAGYNLTVYNRTASKASNLINQGAVHVKSISELVLQSDIIFTMVTDDSAVEEIYLEKILGKEAVTDKLFINMSTVSPSTTKKIAEVFKKMNAKYLDAGVSGSVKPAKEGQLVIMVGGNKDDFEMAKPLLEHLGKLILHVGENGAGSMAKLAINYFLALTIEGFAETVLFAENNGISPEDITSIVNASACGSDITKQKTPSLLEDKYPSAFALKLMAKDVRLAHEAGISYPLTDPLVAVYHSALVEDLGEEDVMAVIKLLRK